MPEQTSSSPKSGYFSEPKTNARAPSTKPVPTVPQSPSIVIDTARYPTVKTTKKIIGRVEK